MGQSTGANRMIFIVVSIIMSTLRDKEAGRGTAGVSPTLFP